MQMSAGVWVWWRGESGGRGGEEGEERDGEEDVVGGHSEFLKLCCHLEWVELFGWRSFLYMVMVMVTIALRWGSLKN